MLLKLTLIGVINILSLTLGCYLLIQHDKQGYSVLLLAIMWTTMIYITLPRRK